jgi:RND family efflux transporter MFP subunit
VRVSTSEVVRADASAEVFVPGTLYARDRAALGARITASILELPHAEGDVVPAGALLVRLDDAALRSAVTAAEAATTAADLELSRDETLLAKGAATPSELDNARASAAAARAALSAAQDNLAYALLRAPFAGRVVARPANLGDVATPGRTLVEIESAAGTELRASVDHERTRALRPGQTLQALVDGQPGRLPATVRLILPAADPATHRVEVRADLPPAPGLRAGLFARLALVEPTAEERLLLPTRAVFARGGLVGAYVIAEGRAHLRWIAVGLASDELTEVRAGLEPGERVALEPEALSDSEPVEDAGAPRRRPAR